MGSRTELGQAGTRTRLRRGISRLERGTFREGGRRTTAILFSLASTCKALGMDPFAYIRDVLERICTYPARRVAQLLPDRWRSIQSGSGSVMSD